MIKILKWLTTLMLLAGLLYLWVRHNNDMMKSEAKAFIYHNVDNIPPKRAALVLGTAKYLKNGHVNYFYTYRIDATEKLFKAGKVKAIVVSGDNGEEEYDEPTQMRDDLIARGIPKEYITLDYAGFRTLDSIVRAEAIFDLSDYIIVSQQFHLERAIYIAHAKGQKVLGFVAKDFQNTIWAKRMEYRELLARAKAFFDLNVWNREPRFYGKKEPVTYKD